MAGATAVHRYRPGEVVTRSLLQLDRLVSAGSGVVCAHVWGFAPGKAAIDTTDASARVLLQPLLDAIRTPVRRSPYFSQLRDVFIFGFTDRVGQGRYNEFQLRKHRAEAVRMLLTRLLSGMTKQPNMVAHPYQPPKKYARYFNKGGDEFSRAKGRAVLIVLKPPKVPDRCVPLAGSAGIIEALTFIRTVLSTREARKKLTAMDIRVLTALIPMLLRNGNDEYVTHGFVKARINEWLKVHRPERDRLNRMSQGQLLAEGSRYRMPPQPSGGAARIAWVAELANRIARTKHPDAYLARTLSLRDRLRDIVRDTCKDQSKVISLLHHTVSEIQSGFDALFKMTFRRAMLQVVGSHLGLSNFDAILDNMVDGALREHFRDLMKKPDSVFSVYAKKK